MALRPQHRVDAPIEYVSINDDSFDEDRYIDEVTQLQVDGENLDEHPIKKYYRGETRYDMDADNVRDYFDKDKKPIVFSIKRLNRQQYTMVLNTISMNEHSSAKIQAFRVGVQAISGEEALKLEGIYSKTKTLSDFDMDRIEKAFGRDIFYEVGDVVITASGDLTVPEKKA